MNILITLKDPARLSQLLAVFFLGGILFSAYSLYQLPNQLSLAGQDVSLAWPYFTKSFLVIGFTFLSGLGAFAVAAQVKREVVVYLEKKKENEQNQAGSTDAETGESNDVSSFRQALQQIKPNEVLQTGLNNLCQQVEAGQGAVYLASRDDSRRLLELKYGFALSIGESQTMRFEFGEGLVGQVAASGKSIYIDEVPEGYIKIVSGLGQSSPRYLFIFPLRVADEVKGVVELAAFHVLKESTRKQLEEMGQILADKIS